MAPEMTEWEKRRAANAKANNELVNKIAKTSVKIFGPPKPVTSRTKSAPKRKSEPGVKRESPVPTRRSARVAGLDAEPETLKRKYEVEAETKAQEAREKRTRVTGDLNLGDIKVEGRAWNGDFAGLGNLKLPAQPGVRTFDEEDVKAVTDKHTKTLIERFNKLELYEKFDVRSEFWLTHFGVSIYAGADVLVQVSS